VGNIKKAVAIAREMKKESFSIEKIIVFTRLDAGAIEKLPVFC